VRLSHPTVRAIRLNFIDGATFVSLAGALIPRERIVLSKADSSLIIYVGPASGTGTLKDLQALLDVYDLRNSAATLIPLKGGDAGDVATNVSRSLGLSDSGFPRILPLQRNKALLVIAPRGFDLADIYRLVEGLDHLTADDSKPIRSITPRQRTAEEIMTALQNLVTQSSGAGGRGGPSGERSAATDPQPVGSIGDADGGSSLRGTLGAKDDLTAESSPFHIGGRGPAGGGDAMSNLSGLRHLVSAATADRSTNRILFSGTAAEFAILKRAVDVLDQSGGQILIEAVVLQVALTDQLQYGVQYALNNARIFGTPVSGSLNTSGASTDGLILQLGGASFQAVIHALDSVTNVSIISDTTGSDPGPWAVSVDLGRFGAVSLVAAGRKSAPTTAGPGAAAPSSTISEGLVASVSA
jgi:general secretion pathway protein D